MHASTLGELAAAFGCTSRERQILFERIARIHRVAAATRHLARFVVFGSFVSEKPDPNDVDIFMVFDDATADAYFGASVFWLRRPAAFGGEQATVEFWQTKRDGSRRGIVEIVETSE